MSNKKSAGIVFVLSAPAGTGKTSLVERLKLEFPCVVQSISYTSRLPRANEQEGVHYHFVSAQQFQERILSGDFLEHVELYGTYYGTSLSWIEERLLQGKMVFLVIDTQGALLLQKLTFNFPIVYIFIKPPSLEELRVRLLKRGSEDAASLEKRLAVAQEELTKEKFYHYSVVNDDFEEAYRALSAILIAEQHRIRKEDGVRG